MTTINDSPASLAVPTGRPPRAGSTLSRPGCGDRDLVANPISEIRHEMPPAGQGCSKLNSLADEPAAAPEAEP